ncbi:hypothetical protein SAMN05428944_7563 [Streptomyces sp. 1222.5]|nr:hypothetical protein BX260_0526 [Streptomyces sp. 5112.2]SED40356.1 hypothetical protein SAMN05428944_7563 [Streptomyces sp. 1222.5]
MRARRTACLGIRRRVAAEACRAGRAKLRYVRISL